MLREIVPSRLAWALLGLLTLCHEASAVQEGDKVRLPRAFGIPDTTAYAGHIFNYSIPADGFEGTVHRYEVTEAGDVRLPGWLRFDAKSRSFIGLPDIADEGKLYICVKAFGSWTNEQVVSDQRLSDKDIFSIEVLTLKPPKDGHCKIEPQMTLMVDADLHFLPLEAKIEMTCSLANCLGVSLEAIRLTAMPHNGYVYPEDSLTMTAGPGDGHKRQKSGIQFEWMMPSDCEGKMTTEAEETLKVVKSTAKDGTLRHLLRHRILGWHVRGTSLGVNHMSGTVSRRQIRDVEGGAAHTPVPGQILPTATVTNDFDWETSASPDIRIVPSMSSPAVDPSDRHPAPTRHHDHIPITPSLTMHSMLPTYLHSTPALPPPRPSVTYVTVDATPTITPVIDPTSTYPTPSETPERLPPPVPPGSIPVPPAPTINNKPVVNKRLKKLVMTAGAIFTYKIPAETFIDEEDGDTRGLALELVLMNGSPVGSASFIQLDKENQTLFALPLSDQTGKYNYLLKAFDNAGESVTESFEVNVWQHPGERNFHHKFKMAVQPRGDWDWHIGWPMDVVRVLSDYFGDGTDTKITITGIVEKTHTISWTNSSLPASPCPREALKQIEKKLNKDSGEPRGVLIKLMNTREITIVHISLEMLGLCKTPVSTGAPAGDNAPPVRRNNIGELQATVGRIFEFKIPEDIFYDFDDGTTRYLSLHLRKIAGESVSPSSWLQFDSKKQELYGLPEESDAGRHEFIMSAADKLGQEANDVFTIDVKKAEHTNYPVELSLHLEEDFETFTSNATKKVLVARHLAKLYYDPDCSKITVRGILKGSVIYSWTNNTLPTDKCPEDSIASLRSKLIESHQQQANASRISRLLVDAMWPEFRVLKAEVRPMGACAGGLPPSTGISPPLAPPIHPEIPEDDDVLVTTIIPALVIIFMLIMATAVACCLYRKRRRGKLSMHDTSFYHKGIPIILSEELEDRPHMGSSGGKRPAIMHEERPPLARDAMTPLMAQGGPIHHRPNEPYHQPSPPYAGGPTMGGTGGTRGSRPRVAPSYRNPPPYVPP